MYDQDLFFSIFNLHAGLDLENTSTLSYDCKADLHECMWKVNTEDKVLKHRMK